ncbi:MAG: hypothetical protein JWO62_2352, partial [Acidimicrobiaceae bacterium]|jgi:hypothetical protein|nr:hypothetical protein [Acidimicrobiaceae bacterium]
LGGQRGRSETPGAGTSPGIARSVIGESPGDRLGHSRERSKLVYWCRRKETRSQTRRSDLHLGVVSVTPRIFGGASFPGKIGTLSAMWPLAVLTVTESGISIDLRSRLLKALLGRFVRHGPSSEWWTATWSDLDSMDLGRRSVVLHAKGQRGCRFVTLTRHRLLPLIEEVVRRQIRVNPVKTTIGWFANPT